MAPTPVLVDQYFNASTGEGDEGEADEVGPWNEGNGLHLVESETTGGEGLDVTPYAPQSGTEITSPFDSTPVGEDRAEKPGVRSVKTQKQKRKLAS